MNQKITNLIAKPLQGISSSLARQLVGNVRYNPDVISMAGEVTTAELYDVDGVHTAIQCSLDAPTKDFGYGLTEGLLGTREAILPFAKKHWGIDASANEVIITSGAQQALHIASRILTDPGDTIAIADAAYLLAMQTFQISHARMLTIASDEEGIIPDALEQHLKQQRIKALYVVSNNANPTGITLSLERRRRLIVLADLYDFIIIEDDPYCALRFDGQVLPSIYTLASQMGLGQRVLFLGSFSTTFIPSLRLGVLIAKDPLYQAAVIMKQYLDINSSCLSQKALEQYLNSGRIDAQINRLRHTYHQRCSALTQAIDEHLSDHLTYHLPDGGVFLWARLKQSINALELLPYAIKEKLIFIPGATFYTNKPCFSTLRFCYSSVPADQMEEAMLRLGRALKQYMADHL